MKKNITFRQVFITSVSVIERTFLIVLKKTDFGEIKKEL